MSKILYLSCHSVLEFDEVSLLHELGHEVFSPGAYVEPKNPGDSSMRPGINDLTYDKDVLQKFHAIGQQFPGQDAKDHLTKEIVDCFDTIIVMHMPRWIKFNWPVIKDKRVIWRTIGQSVQSTEDSLRAHRKAGLKIVRYSPMECNIPGYIGGDALIRFYKDPHEYKKWNGEKKQVINFTQHMKQRDRACNYSVFEETTRPFDRQLFGPGNESVGPWGVGKVSFDRLKQEMQDNRTYFYTGTHPASYTLNFIEAWMTGIPVVAIGSKYGNANYFRNHNLYEIPQLIQNGVNGFISNNPAELQGYIRELMGNEELAKQISIAGRSSAIKHFGKEIIKEKWKNFLE